jgi:hypothetical protein
MNFAHAEKIAAAVLYEGYILYPYRATATKNVQRWNFGTLYPRDYAEAQRPAESYRLFAECLLETDREATLDIRIRFLHLVRQQVENRPAWDAGMERTFELNSIGLAELIRGVHGSFFFPATDAEPVDAAAQPICGECVVRATAITDLLYRVSLELTNITAVPEPSGCSRELAMLRSFVSAHALLGVTEGDFVSLLETPAALREAAAACRNQGVFPVLVGAPGERSTMLCSPIILYDYPQVAPESLGDFFDGTEMDEMLALRVLTLTEEEKQEMRSTDPRASRILERTELLPAEQLAKVHGAVRGMRAVGSLAKESA